MRGDISSGLAVFARLFSAIDRHAGNAASTCRSELPEVLGPSRSNTPRAATSPPSRRSRAGRCPCRRSCSFGSSAPMSLRDRRQQVDGHGRLAADRCRPGFLPGQRAMNGSRTPPSNVVPLPFAQRRREPAVIAVDEPRAVVGGEDHQRVVVQSCFFSVSRSARPTSRFPRSRRRTGPLSDLPLNLSETNSGTCGIVWAT